MRKTYKSIISIILVLSMLFCATVSSFAAGTDEEYISELRMIYAEDYEEAMEILEDSEFSDYKLFSENLNADTDEIGVWLAYKTTTDIDDAITDLAIMQMNGGYTLGNYQEMIEESYEEYVAMGEIYLEAIEYFTEAYEAGDFLAEIAFRQMNFYNVESVGIPEDQIPSFEGERLGDIFIDGIDEYELATMFMQGNSHALSSIRSLLAMGVSYNEDGTNYLQRVGMEVGWLQDDPDLYDGEDYDELAEIISSTILNVRDILKEFDSVESDLDYTKEEYGEKELRYLEYKAVAELLRKVRYIGGKTLYEFCLSYEVKEDDYSSLYPLVAALNGGQTAMTKALHFYDVIRYSVPGYSEEAIEAQLADLEERYGKYPFNVYTGVDRTIYYESFAITSDASRADAYTESGLDEAFFGADNADATFGAILSGSIGTGLFLGAIMMDNAYVELSTAYAQKVMTDVADLTTFGINRLATQTATFEFGGKFGVYSYEQLINNYMATVMSNTNQVVDFTSWNFAEKISYLKSNMEGVETLDRVDYVQCRGIFAEANDIEAPYAAEGRQLLLNSPNDGLLMFTGALYIIGGAMMFYSAFRLGKTIYDYYHPEYEDVPIAMVDLVNTVDGDRFIKYDVVYNAETNEDGVHEAGDLNAFEANRWNALYYTKSYEAGKPLLANTFSISNNNSKPGTGYAPVHRFGEVVCYDLNKYNFDYDTNIYLSVKQSKKDKSAVADVPEVIGSMVGAGFLFLAGGVGTVLGVGGTFATQELLKRKKSKSDADTDSEE